MFPIRFPMLVRTVLSAFLIAALATVVGPVRAAQPAGPPAWPPPAPVISALFPAGLQRGTAVSVTLSGRWLGGASAVRVGGQGVSAELLPAAPPAKPDAEQVRVVKLTAAATAEPGLRELRVITPGGVSNVGRLGVGTLPEVTETEPNDEALGMPLRRLPLVVNGRIGRTEDRDRFRFTALAGQQLVFELCALAQHPCADRTETGWFEGFLTLRDAAGRQLATAAYSTVRPDPALVHRFESDGPYVIEVRDAAFRGRREFTYRLTVGELPFITRVFPQGGKAGVKTRIRLDGINLGGGTIKEVTLPPQTLAGQFWYSVDTPAGTSNRVPLQVGEDPEFVETEPNDTSGHATSLTVPSIANGVIERDGDVDYYRFSAGKGQRLLFAIVARATGSPLSAKLELQDDRGRQLRLLDGAPDAREAMLDHTFSSDGSYVIRVTDARGYGGPLFGYRLELRPPRPDFALTVSPGNPRVAAGGTTVLCVTAQRRDGFEGDIAITLPQLPAGATAGPVTLTGKQTEGLLSLTVPDSAAPALLPLTVQGKAAVADRESVRTAIPVETMFSPDRPREFAVADLPLSIVPRGPFALAWAAPAVKVRAGDKAEVTLRIRRAAGFAAPLRVALQRLPRHLSASPVNVRANENEAKLVIFAASKANPGPAAAFAHGTVTDTALSFTQNSPVLAIETLPPPNGR